MAYQNDGHKSKNMKMNKTKLAILLSTFGVLMIVASKPVSADGAYGLGTDLPEYKVVHATVNAGVEDFTPQAIITLMSLTGLVTTSLLIKKTK